MQIDYTESSGNIFADLDLPNPEEHLLRAQLAFEIDKIIEQKGWTSFQAAQAVDVAEENISQLLRGKISTFSIPLLFTILKRLGHRVEVRISSAEFEPEESQIL